MLTMKTVVAFTGNKVNVLCGDVRGGRIEIEKLLHVAFPIDCVMNGVVTDPEAFCEGVRETWSRHKLPKTGVILSVDGNHIQVKKTQLPKTGRKRTQEMLAYEFRDSGSGEQEWVYSGIDLGPVKTTDTAPEKGGPAPAEIREILGAAAEKNYIAELAEVFSQAGVKLSSIYPSRFSMVRGLSYLEAIRERDCIIESLDGEVLSTVLVEQGSYVNFSSSRVFSDHGSPAFGGEVARTVSQLLQFQSMVKSEHRATDVYCVGFSPEDFQVSSQQVSALGMTASLLEDSPSIRITGGSIRDCFDHAGALAFGKGPGSLYREKTAKEEKLKRRDAFLARLLPYLALFAVFSVISSMLITTNISKQRELDQLHAYLEDPENIARQQEYSSCLEEAARYNARLTLVEELKDSLDSYPRAVSALGRIISGVGEGIVDTTVSSYDAATGSLTLAATGSSAETLNEFIKGLMDTGIFLEVTYSGYDLVENTGEYNVNVSCVLSPSAGR